MAYEYGVVVMTDLNVGDRVQLASGGPIMTIADISGDQALCQWFDRNRKADERWFTLAALCKYNPKSPGVLRTRSF